MIIYSKPIHVLRLFAILTVFPSLLFSNSFSEKFSKKNDINLPFSDSTKISGVSVSPARVNFFLKPGEVKSREITITNYTSSEQKFKISIRDFGITHSGKSDILGENKTNKYSLKKWMNVSPNFVTLGPSEERKVKVRISIPNNDENNHAAWSMLLVEQIKQKSAFNPSNKTGNTMGFGITPSFAFGIWLYQNPPYLDKTIVDILSFKYTNEIEKTYLSSEVENTSENIAFCKSYIEITNLINGTTTKIADKKFTLLPTHKRILKFPLPKGLLEGNYSSVIVVDFGNENEISIGEMEFNITE